jgi:hypothetical protein
MSEEVNDAPNTMQQSHPTLAENMAKEANSRTRDDSPASSSHSIAGTTQGEHSKLLNFSKSSY